jgi:uncharacterized membrane protein HdeD (DUF308 family)
MKRVSVLGVVALVLGMVILLAKLTSDGLTLSFVLLLGALLALDGALRLLTPRAESEVERERGPRSTPPGGV